MNPPGPIMPSHQPSLVSCAEDFACADGESPVNSRIALLRVAFSSPQVSYATRAPCNTPPRHIGSGSGRRAKWRASIFRELSVIVFERRGANRKAGNPDREPGSGLGIAALVDAL